MVASVTGFVAHGILRPLLEARGVAPWSLKDSLGSTPLVLIGGALVGGAVAIGAALVVPPCARSSAIAALAIAAVAVGLVTMKLGLVAIRKVV